MSNRVQGPLSEFYLGPHPGSLACADPSIINLFTETDPNFSTMRLIGLLKSFKLTSEMDRSAMEFIINFIMYHDRSWQLRHSCRPVYDWAYYRRYLHTYFYGHDIRDMDHAIFFKQPDMYQKM